MAKGYHYGSSYVGLKEMRKRKGLTQKDLGSMLGVSQQTIAQYEKSPETLQNATLLKLAAALQCDVRRIAPLYDEKLAQEYADHIFRMEWGENNITAAEHSQDIAPQEILDTVAPLTFSELLLIETFRDLNRLGRDKVEDYMYDLLENSTDRYKNMPTDQDTAPDPDHQDTE